MKLKSNVLVLPKLDITCDGEKFNEFQQKLDDEVGYKKTAIGVCYTPNNRTIKFAVEIWVMGKTDNENADIFEKIVKFLDETNIEYISYDTFTIWDEERVYIEYTSNR